MMDRCGHRLMGLDGRRFAELNNLLYDALRSFLWCPAYGCPRFDPRSPWAVQIQSAWCPPDGLSNNFPQPTGGAACGLSGTDPQNQISDGAPDTTHAVQIGHGIAHRPCIDQLPGGTRVAGVVNEGDGYIMPHHASGRRGVGGGNGVNLLQEVEVVGHAPAQGRVAELGQARQLAGGVRRPSPSRYSTASTEELMPDTSEKPARQIPSISTWYRNTL